MTQLALLLALGSISLVLSLLLGRLEVRRGPVAPTLKRIEGAVERAAVALLRLAGGHALLLLGLVGMGLAGSSLLLAKPSSEISTTGRIAFMAVALLAGALCSFVQARLTVALGARACSAAAAATARGSSRSLRPLLRASGALAGFGEGLALLSVALAFAALYAVLGGFAQPTASVALASEVVRLLPALALGAAVAALALARGGGTLAAATLVGGGPTAEREAQLDAMDPRSPATLAELLSEQVGGLLPQALSSYVAGVTGNVAAALLAVRAAAQPASSEAPLTCLLLISILRAFGILGSMCGLFAARSEESEPPEQALLRGQLSALSVSLFGLCAGLYWLRVEPLLGLFVPGALGLGVAALLTQVAWWPLRRDASAARETTEARSFGDGAAVARGAGAGLSCLLPLLLLPAIALWMTERVPLADGPAPSQALVLAAFVAGLMATAPFSMAVAGFGSLCDAAQAAAGLARLETEGKRSSLRLDEASSVGGGAAASHATLALAASLLLGLFALHGASLEASPGRQLSAVCGAIVLVLLFAAGASRRALLGARGVADEVRRQLKGLPRRQGSVAVPADFTPSYKACVDSALDSARDRWLLGPVWALLVPFGLALALLGDKDQRAGLFGFGGAVVICGLTFVLGARATRAALRDARRRFRHLEPAGPGSLGGPQHFGDLVGLGAATGVEALMSVVALTTLALSSLLG
ncbi:MAG TPA: sodium/proton-translocating pyrophosphatase [Polyangiaceae bacterium]|nr:sodium/proton-translocating pyrophosphatase [Polyangiaceae bacterium]